MPLTSKGEEILSAFRAEYGAAKGEEYFYAAHNKGTISGIDAAGATTRFYEDRQISANRGLTHEGFMICRDCAIARVGRYIYSKDELPRLTASRDGIIYVDRTEDEVFDEKSMRSFEGKPVTIDHPPEDVTPANWKDYAVGTVFNVRRGRGTMADSLVADLLLTDADAIRIVKSNDKTELSCGYDAQYHQVVDGRGSQTNIVGNHVAIVDNGRCGGACRIGDSAMTTSTWKDRLRNAFKTRSLDEFEKAMEEKDKADKGGGDASGAAGAAAGGAGDGKGAADDGKGAAAGGEGGAADDGKGGVHHHITVNVGGAGAAGDPAAGAAGAAAGAAGAGAGAAGAGAAAEDTDPISVIVNAITALAARIDALEQKISGGGTDDPDAAAAAAGDQTGASGGASTQDRAGVKTVDAKVVDAVTVEFNDARSLAEILRPGIKPPTLTLDAKMDVAKTRDSICAFRRRAMEDAFDDTKSVAAFDGLIKDKAEIRTMTCDAAKVLFVAASAKMRDINNASLHQGAAASQVKSGPRTIAEVNAANRKFHADVH